MSEAPAPGPQRPGDPVGGWIPDTSMPIAEDPLSSRENPSPDRPCHVPDGEAVAPSPSPTRPEGVAWLTALLGSEPPLPSFARVGPAGAAAGVVPPGVTVATKCRR